MGASLFRIIIAICFKIIEAVCTLLTITNYWKKPRRCPPINDKILLYPACILAEKIRKREVSYHFKLFLHEQVNLLTKKRPISKM